MPLEIQNDVWSVTSATVKMQNLLLQRSGSSYSEIFDTANNYLVRNGQIILDKNKVLQIVLDGRLLPSKKAKDVQLNRVALPDNIFQPTTSSEIPSDIQKRLKLLFAE